MKKLLITSMAAVAIGLYAKADDTGFISGTSFEEDGVPNAGESYFEPSEDSDSYDIDDFWTWGKKEGEETVAPSADEGLFTVTNVSDVTYPSRPAQWEGKANNKALAIDTGIPLLRNVNSNKSPTSLGTAVFFDSVVQFTATEAAPTPDSANGDKLMVWLYASDDVDNDNPGVFGETTPITNLVITAGYGDDQIATNYLTNLEVVPETWHRLTIKALNDIDPDEDTVVPGFEVRLDGNEVSGVLDYQNTGADRVTTFPSLMASDTEGNNNIIGVAFDGKGAVDDLVFTTADPFAGGGGEEPATYAIIATGSNADFVFYDSEEDVIVANAIPVGLTTVGISVAPKNNYTLSSATFNGTDISPLPVYNPANQDYYFEIKVPNTDGVVVAGSEFAFSVVMTSGAGSTTPTVDGNSCADDTALKAVVKSGTEITVPSDWAVDGKILKKADGTPFATFEYYNLTQNGNTVIATLDQKAAAPFAKAEELTEGLEEVLDMDATMKDGNNNDVPAVGICIKTFNGLYYGLGTAAELGSSWNGPTDWEDGNGGVIQLKAAKQGDTRFYKIVVTDIKPASAE